MVTRGEGRVSRESATQYQRAGLSTPSFFGTLLLMSTLCGLEWPNLA